MLDEGLRAGLSYLGVSHRTVCHVEREAHAAAVLAARMEEGSMAAAPVWSDVCTFDATAWHGRVDCVVAGFPCQDLSVAGRRAGLDGQRSGLFFEVVRIATDCGAWLLFLENVAGIASATASVVDPEEGVLDERAAARVMGELADCGWDAEWITLAASDVGASHGRARWFCLAWRMADACRDGGPGPHGQGGRGRGVCEAGDSLGHTGPQHQQLQQRSDGSKHQAAGQRVEQPQGIGRQERRAEPAGQQGRSDAPEHGGALDDAYSAGQRSGGRGRDDRPGQPRGDAELAGAGHMADAGGQRQPQPARGELARPDGEPRGLAEPFAGGDALPLFAPGPADPRWPAILAAHPELAPALEPAFRRVVDGLAFDMGDSRAARLKCIGNGVVALQAATAFVVLAGRAGAALN